MSWVKSRAHRRKSEALASPPPNHSRPDLGTDLGIGYRGCRLPVEQIQNQRSAPSEHVVHNGARRLPTHPPDRPRRARSGASRRPNTKGAAQSSLTEEEMMSYIEGFAVMEVAVRGVLPIGDSTESVPYLILDTAKSAIVGQVILPKAVKRSLAVAITVKVPAAAGSLAIGTFDDGGNFQVASFLRVETPAVERPDGAVGPSGR
ncbi:hypothetical protein LB543_09105 [Mesorhizobium sp. ESP7-2]|uniref:hypothetical protein n=2 Tax=unclassified Mesorhizobium TaxID=325217 RepID=UPI001CCCE198|nr:hypothetical protein [Mesorhizobium sp. ESP7-2]MBZ9706876.1 hypothetical protein [Mesorhizobium sp. ESP7-2]